MKKVKLFSSTIFALIVFFGLWISSVFWVPKIADFLNSEIVCKNGASTVEKPPADKNAKPKCVDSIAELGATGDLFGAVNSLFTALALFAVALTLWLDGKARRQTLKPLVISVADKDFFIIEYPREVDNTTLRLLITPHLSNIVSEPALNVSIVVGIKCKKFVQELPAKIYETPLVAGVSLPIEIDFSIDGDFLRAFLERLTENDGEIEVSMETRYENLDMVAWVTSVSYKLTLHSKSDTTKLNAIREHHVDVIDIWGGAAVALKAAVVTGSWKRTLVEA